MDSRWARSLAIVLAAAVSCVVSSGRATQPVVVVAVEGTSVTLNCSATLPLEGSQKNPQFVWKFSAANSQDAAKWIIRHQAGDSCVAPTRLASRIAWSGGKPSLDAAHLVLDPVSARDAGTFSCNVAGTTVGSTLLVTAPAPTAAAPTPAAAPSPAAAPPAADLQCCTVALAVVSCFLCLFSGILTALLLRRTRCCCGCLCQ
ncbi:uncharacterized protein LOC133358454 isoform X2 [Lethenteron reissneri]|uniref:uncharacterized protein LOC133358454 isoform X2 n=1 Tax=Lethenteron reissneri TaxID=7753 RepID=UPI002AB76640|nr:uncharacterized protein LOC133358454 isoform X2 [Lethenteron reissneri]